MARMIPPHIDLSCLSPGEVLLFEKIKDDPATSDWFVLHSLNVAKHNNQMEGEADFVIIVPELGVLVLEVKAHHSVARRGGLWYLGRDAEGKLRSPFKQAADTMQSLLQRIRDLRPELSNTLFWSAVGFTHCSFDMESPEWHDWQYFDAGKFANTPISEIVLSMLRAASKHVTRCPTAKWFKPERKQPTPKQSQELVDILRGDFEFYCNPSIKLQLADKDIKRFTEEQYVALDAMNDNPRVSFVGPAGTGKTLLAIEAASRAVKQNKKVLFLSYNKLLGEWLRKECEPLSPAVRTERIHQFLIKIASLSVPENPGKNFWDTELAESAMERIITESREPEYDLLIIDEAQDLLRQPFVDVVDLCLKGGLAGGEWRVFGDFSNQKIFKGSGVIELDAFNKNYGGLPYRLAQNCRNTPSIAEYACLLGTMQAPYSKILRTDNGITPILHYYKDNGQQFRQLKAIIEQLYLDGFKAADIVILCQTRSDLLLSCPELSAILENGRKIRVESISAFKGLEASAIVLANIDSLDGDWNHSVFYIGITRALNCLHICLNDKLKPEILKLVARVPMSV